MQDKYLNADIAFLLKMNDRKPTGQPPKLISKFINGLRVMPPGSPIEGIYDINLTPYLIEPIDNMSPFSEIRHTAMKKGVQIAATTGGENIIAYYIGGRPGRVMYMSATDELLEIFSSDRLDPLIDSCGFRDLISDQSESFHSRKTGDKSKYKQFPGGVLILTSAQSAGRMRSSSIKIMIRDEIDGAPRQLSTGEGNFLAVSEGRLEAFGSRAKIFDMSTPTLTGESLIDDQYEKGDKRFFMVPCPNCGKFQYLSLGNEKSDYGLKGSYEKGELIQAYYQCIHCHDPIYDHHKQFLLSNGHWEPSTKPIDKYFRSYHLPSFYSPPGMTSFTKIRKKYDEAIDKGDEELRSFTNLYLGKSFEATGEQPEFKSVIEARSKYKSGEVPPGILYLTMFVDVQRGKDKFKNYTQEEITAYAKQNKNNHVRLQEMPRLEAEVVGHGTQYRTASILWNTIYGQINNYAMGAWAQLNDWIEPGLNYERKDGFSFPVQTILIDSGDGKYSDLVANFCAPLPYTYASKGAGTPKKDKLKLVDIDSMVAGNIYNIKLSKSSNNQNIVLINTNYYKGHIYRNFKNVSQGSDVQLPSSHITPSDYPDYYFQQLRAEKQKTDGTFHNPANKRNEALDSLVGNKAASDFIIQGFIEADRDKLKRKFPALRAKSRDADEKLRELVNRETVTRSIIEELVKIGWGKDEN